MPDTPVPVSGTVTDGATSPVVVLTLSEPMDTDVLPSAADFILKDGLMVARNNDGASWDDSTHLRITFSPGLSEIEPFTLDYAASGTRLQSAEGAALADFTGFGLTYI